MTRSPGCLPTGLTACDHGLAHVGAAVNDLAVHWHARARPHQHQIAQAQLTDWNGFGAAIRAQPVGRVGHELGQAFRAPEAWRTDRISIQ